MQSAWIREAGGSNYIPLGLVYVFAKDLYNVQKELLGYAETLLILCQDKRAGASCTHTIFHRSNIEKISSLMLERLLRGRFTKVYRAKHEKYVNHHAQVLALSKKRRLTYEEIRSMIREGIQVQIPSQPHCLEKVEVHVLKELQEKAGTFAESVFSALCEPEERSSITQERIDWLKLCIQMKGKSVDEKKAAIKIHFESHELGNASEYVGNTNSEDFYSQLMEKEAGNTKELQELENKAKELRIDMLKMLNRAGSGHTGGPLGLADIFSVLYFNTLNHNPKDPFWEKRDRLILSAGHLAG